MKECPYCKAQLEDNIQICPNCNIEVPAKQPVDDMSFECAAPIGDEASAPVTIPATAKKKTGKIIALICIAAVLVAAIVFVIIGFITDWFRPPLARLEDALEKTFASDSITLDFDLEFKDSKTGTTAGIRLFSKLILDREAENLDLHLLYEYSGTVMKILAADEKMYVLSAGSQNSFAEIVDIEEDQFKDIFDALDEKQEPDDEALEELLKQVGIDADVDSLRAFGESFKKDCLENKAWLEEYWGYRKSDNRHKFKIDLDKFMDEIADRAYEFDVISKSQKKQLSSLDIDTKLNIEIIVEDGLVSKIKCYTRGSDPIVSMELSFNDIGSTALTQEEKDQTINEVNDLIAKLYANCGGCSKQGEKNSMYAANSAHYCSDCFWYMDYCDACGNFVYKNTFTTIGGSSICVECNKTYAQTHTCDLCGEIVGVNFICSNHARTDDCPGCDIYRLLAFYNIKTKELLCSSCS